MAFPREFMDELLARTDIVSVVSRYVNLSRRGTGYLGLCPFHNEKTPSFSVSSDKQFFYCFGCGTGGDVITFVMKIENIDFSEAVAKLAEWAGVQIPESTYGAEERGKRKRLNEALRFAAKYYHESLKGDGGEEARKYLLGRGLTPTTITNFGLGFSPDKWDGLLGELTAKGYTKSELIEAGLERVGKNGKIYDWFRARVMFPIIDVRGAVIGFGGRNMGPEEPKYLNSPESAVFNKRKNLYAMNFAKQSKADYFILCEGYMDVIAMHQAGFDSAVASLGTALGEDQAHLMSKYKGKVIISYDSDKAGRAATERAIDILTKANLEVRVLTVRGAKDPDEYIKKFGRESFGKLIESALPASEYRLEMTKQTYDLSDDDQRVLYIKEAVAYLAKMSNAFEREIYAGRVSRETGVTSDSILKEAERERKKLLNQKKKDEERRVLDPISSIMPKEKSARYKNPRSAVAEEALLSLAATDAALCRTAAEKVSGKMFSSELLGRAFDKLCTHVRETGETASLRSICENMTDDESSHIAAVFARRRDTEKSALSDYLDIIKQEYIKGQGECDDAALLAAAEFYRKKKGKQDG